MNDDIIELPTTKTRTPWKTITIGTLFIFSCGGYCTMSLYSKGMEAFTDWKDKYIETQVEDYLKTHPIEIDSRKGKSLPIEVKREDLLKMVYITHNRMAQCEMSIQLVKDTINLSEVK